VDLWSLKGLVSLLYALAETRLTLFVCSPRVAVESTTDNREYLT